MSLSYPSDWQTVLDQFQIDAEQLAQFEQLIMAQAQAQLQAPMRPGISNQGEIEQSFYSTELPEQGLGFERYGQLLSEIIGTAVNTERPDFVGHMTSALPSFMPAMIKLMARLNQNTVKLETSGGLTDLERQLIGLLHRQFYRDDYDEAAFRQLIHKPKQAMGVFCSGGTMANLMALWVARNRFLGPHGVADEGVAGALLNSGYKGLAILVSERGHYSLSKAADVLGLGRNNLRSVAVDSEHRMDLGDLQRQLDELAADNIKVLAIVAVAGATETGSIDPLAQLAAIAKDQNCHFHVDGAWGGAAIFSAEQRLKLAGIELADSITLDAHKQLYTPMGAGMVLFRSPDLVNVIKHHASYIIRSDSKDLGAYTLEGSRPAMALLLHAGLHLIGSRGYGALIDHSVRLAKDFAQLIDKADDFELMLQPELNILVYRYIPTAWTAAVRAEPSAWVEPLNRLTKAIQIAQAAGKRSFVSRTKLHLPARSEQDLTVFRVVLANPKTQLSDLQGVLSQQRQIAEEILAAGEFTQYPQAAAGEEN